MVESIECVGKARDYGRKAEVSAKRRSSQNILTLYRQEARAQQLREIRVPKLYTITMPSIGDRSMDYFFYVCHMKKLSKPCKKLKERQNERNEVERGGGRIYLELAVSESQV
ncbi:hypothetical protein RND71_008000 [Anisodus tanguticus]|uniref:Uncharacterized protein n=1 Tax=Anisodus tanguticus TaxID=243964 RepID=A0AAE1SMZ5_9SOLA|nr:hypothetical protein RND71_008000 [Anisodus tanguticus]